MRLSIILLMILQFSALRICQSHAGLAPTPTNSRKSLNDSASSTPLPTPLPATGIILSDSYDDMDFCYPLAGRTLDNKFGGAIASTWNNEGGLAYSDTTSTSMAALGGSPSVTVSFPVNPAFALQLEAKAIARLLDEYYASSNTPKMQSLGFWRMPNVKNYRGALVNLVVVGNHKFQIDVWYHSASGFRHLNSAPINNNIMLDSNGDLPLKVVYNYTDTTTTGTLCGSIYANDQKVTDFYASDMAPAGNAAGIGAVEYLTLWDDFKVSQVTPQPTPSATATATPTPTPAPNRVIWSDDFNDMREGLPINGRSTNNALGGSYASARWIDTLPQGMPAVASLQPNNQTMALATGLNWTEVADTGVEIGATYRLDCVYKLANMWSAIGFERSETRDRAEGIWGKGGMMIACGGAGQYELTWYEIAWWDGKGFPPGIWYTLMSPDFHDRDSNGNLPISILYTADDRSTTSSLHFKFFVNGRYKGQYDISGFAPTGHAVGFAGAYQPVYIDNVVFSQTSDAPPTPPATPAKPPIPIKNVLFSDTFDDATSGFDLQGRQLDNALGGTQTRKWSNSDIAQTIHNDIRGSMAAFAYGYPLVTFTPNSQRNYLLEALCSSTGLFQQTQYELGFWRKPGNRYVGAGIYLESNPAGMSDIRMLYTDSNDHWKYYNYSKVGASCRDANGSYPIKILYGYTDTSNVGSMYGTVWSNDQYVCTFATDDMAPAGNAVGMSSNSVEANIDNFRLSEIDAAAYSMNPASPVLQHEPAFTKGHENTLDWKHVPYATKVVVQASHSAAFSSTDSVASSEFSGTCIFTNLADGKYYYRARSKRGNYTSAWSDITSSTQDATGPSRVSKPTFPKAVSSSPQITFAWSPATDSGCGVSLYEYQIWSIPAGVSQTGVIDSTSVQITGKHGVPIYTKVRAIDKVGNNGLWSDASNPVLIDQAPIVASLSILPENPGTKDNLMAMIDVSDPDGGPTHRIAYDWYMGAALKYSGSRLPYTMTQKGQVWEVRAKAMDSFGIWGNEASATVTIGNSAPSHPIVRIAPRQMASPQDLTLEITQPSIDPDGDPLSYEVTWMKSTDGGRNWNAVTELTGLWAAPKSLLKTGETWRAVCTPIEAAATGGPASSKQAMSETLLKGEPSWDQVYVGQNNPPALVIDPPVGKLIQNSLTVTVKWNAHDDDGDTCTLELYLGGAGYNAPQPIVPATSQLVGETMKKMQVPYNEPIVIQGILTDSKGAVTRIMTDPKTIPQEFLSAEQWVLY